MKMIVRKPKTKADLAAAAREAADALRAGKLVAFGTETVYGLGALASLPEAEAALRELKGRPDAPFSLAIASAAAAERYVEFVPLTARWAMERCWPGPVTVLLPAGAGLVGLRCPDHEMALAILDCVDEPVLLPSANLAGGPSAKCGADVIAGLGDRIPLLIDTGPGQDGQDSTIVRFDRGGRWEIVRKGTADAKTITQAVSRRILFVCTGNTCRSPMAEGICKTMLASQLDCSVGELASRGVEVISCGTSAWGGAAATPEAVDAAGDSGSDITSHRSQNLTKELIIGADMVWCMGESHVDEATRIAPKASNRIELLDRGGSISDPIGCGGSVYRKTARQIAGAIARRLEDR
jgi:tRNA threonylcarbamoyl adenosine modification protein (Sua5/YciO/YrdC/YwlC family)